LGGAVEQKNDQLIRLGKYKNSRPLWDGSEYPRCHPIWCCNSNSILLQVDNRTTCAPYPYRFSEQLRGGFRVPTYRLPPTAGSLSKVKQTY